MKAYIETDEQYTARVHNLKYFERLKNIAEDIIADDEWVKDSHTQSEHNGIKAGLYALIHHLEEVSDEDN